MREVTTDINGMTNVTWSHLFVPCHRLSPIIILLTEIDFPPILALKSRPDLEQNDID